MKKIMPPLAAGLIGLLMAGAAHATTIFADNFESETTGLNKTNFLNWTVTDGSVDLIGTGTPWNWFPANGKYVDMDGSTSNAGKMTSSVLNLMAGDYLLSFDLAGNQRSGNQDMVQVKVNNGITSQDYSLATSAPFQTFTQSFTLNAPTAVQLSFEGWYHDNMGMLLDNVQLEMVDQVPEPATLLLLGTGLAGLATLRRRRF